MRFLVSGFAVLVLGVSARGQPQGDPPPPLQYTVRSEKGTRTSQDRDSVLKTLEMTDDQLRAWAEANDDKAVKENRSATLFQSGYVETISRGETGKLQYTVGDRVGRRTSRDRQSVLKTVGMTAAQVKTWAEAPEGKAEGREVSREGKPVALVTVSNSNASVSGRDFKSASNALKGTADQLREWARDEKGAKEDRSVLLFQSGHVEAIWRGSSGQLLHGVRTERGSTTSRDHASVLKTVKLTDDETRAWAQDEKGAREERTAVFIKSGYVEIISRGRAEEPPGLGQ